MGNRSDLVQAILDLGDDDFEEAIASLLESASDGQKREFVDMLGPDLLDAQDKARRLDHQATDARHILAWHSRLGFRREAVRLALAALWGEPHAPCSCVGGRR